MPHVRKNGLPAYKQIQGTIVKRVERGLLKPGDLVDSERELARIHGVSLMTARHALIALEREGMVVRRRGAGTFVAPPKIHFNKLMSYTEQMSGRGLAVSSKVLSLEHHSYGAGNCCATRVAGHRAAGEARTPEAKRR